ncbi:MAG: YIP1 family protein [Pyrinomonadaceae bacterium]
MQKEKKFDLWKMIGILYQPRATFREIDNHPNWLLPLLGAILFNVGYVFLFFNAGNVPVSGRMVLYTGYAAGVLLSVLICSGVFLLCLFLLGAQVTFKKVFSVVAHTYFLYTLINVVLGTLILKASPDSSGIDPQNPVISNLGILVNPQLHPALYRLAISFDLFSIYFLILTALGFSIISRKMSFKGSMGTVVAVWSFYVAAAVLIKAIVA